MSNLSQDLSSNVLVLTPILVTVSGPRTANTSFPARLAELVQGAIPLYLASPVSVAGPVEIQV